MPVATAESFVDKKEKSQVNSRQRKKSTSVVVDSESTRQLAGNVHLDNQPSASYIPTHSPILNLSPNLSPESHPDSSSPVFELLDSNQRRTVQGESSNLLCKLNCTSTPVLGILNACIVYCF